MNLLEVHVLSALQPNAELRGVDIDARQRALQALMRPLLSGQEKNLIKEQQRLVNAFDATVTTFRRQSFRELIPTADPPLSPAFMLFQKRMSIAYREAKLGYDLGHTENINAPVPSALSDQAVTPVQMNSMRAAQFQTHVPSAQVVSTKVQAGCRKFRDVGVQIQDEQMQSCIVQTLSTAIFNPPSRLPSVVQNIPGPLGTTSWVVANESGE